MTLGHEMCKINHLIWIRTPNGIWRPVEPSVCLLDITWNRENRDFSKYLEFQSSLFLVQLHILPNKKIWDICLWWNLRDCDILPMGYIPEVHEPFWLHPSYFWAFLKTSNFRDFRLHQKINHSSKWLGTNARKCFVIGYHDPAPRYIPTPCSKSQILVQNSRFSWFSRKFTFLSPHQQNRIASTKFDLVDVGDINTIILIIGHQAIRGIGSNLGHVLWPK